MSALLELWRKHRKEIDDLRKSCKHDKKFIIKRTDSSQVGCGSVYPSIHITCTNCGCQKIIFGLLPSEMKQVRLTLEKQGFKKPKPRWEDDSRVIEERLGLRVEYEWELEKK